MIPALDAASWARQLSISREAVELYLASEVIDLHLDTFIWARSFGYDLTRRHGRAPLGGWFLGHADFPRVREAGRTVDIPFAFDAIERQPNTLDAHRLIAWAQSRPEGDADALVEKLFHAYFVEGRYLGDRDELVRIAAAAGFDPDDARAFMASDALRGEVAGAEQRAREMGISGVPFFIFAGKTAVSGAHEPATLLEAIAQARSSR